MSKNSEPHDKSRYAGKIFISLVLIRLGSQPFKDINVVRFFILSIARLSLKFLQGNISSQFVGKYVEMASEN